MGTDRPTPQTSSERRYVTVLFSDLSGYTAMSESLDPEDVQDITGRVFTAIGEIVTRFEGRMDRLLGDAVLVLFGDPVAHEDDAERAVRTALEIHRTVDALSPEIERRTGHALRLHTGVNSGLVVTGGRVQDVATGPLGDTVNMASRLQSIAGPGEIVIGDNTAALVSGIFELEDAGAHTVKGKSEPVRASRVLGLAAKRSAPSRRRGTFVGRHEELGALLGALERVRDGGRGIITIVGDAGAGKTRLLAEFRERASDDVQWLEGRAYAHGTSIPYAPVIDLISRVAGIGEHDTQDEVRRKLSDAVTAAVDTDVDAVLAPLLRLYAVETAAEAATDREAFHERLLAATMRILGSLARRAPTILCVQDLHWADPSTMTLFAQLAHGTEAPVLFLCNTRPGATVEGTEHVIQLSDLSTRQTRELVASLLEDEDPPPELIELVTSRAEGNPFFVEEIVNSLIESHAVQRNGSGWTITASAELAAVPSTIRGVIAARIDRLDDQRKRVLREAAVVGREFLFRIMSDVTELGAELGPALDVLTSADLIRERTTDPDLEYIFKHALTQEVAYDGLVKVERQQLHARVARAIEAQLGHREAELVEMLAYHWLRAGDVDHAVRYLRMAGRKAIERYALSEASTYFRDAYALLKDRDRSPEDQRNLAETLLDWMLVFYYTNDLRTAAELLHRHETDIESIGDPELLGMALAWRGNAEWIGGRVKNGLELIERAITIGEREDNAVILAHAIAWKIWILFLSARPSEAPALAERLKDLIPRLDDPRYVVIKSQAGLGFCFAALAMIPEARAVADGLATLGEETGSRRALAMAHGVRSALATIAGDWEFGVTEGRLGVDAATDPIYKATVMAALHVNLGQRGDAQALRDAVDESQPYMTEALDQLWNFVDSVCLILEGKPARGIKELENSKNVANEHDVDWITLLVDAYLAIMYARIATREVQAEASVALRNPGFVIRHAIPARRKAHRAFEQWKEKFVDTGRTRLLFIVYYEWAKLLVSEKRTDEAARLLRIALDATDVYGPSEGRTQAQALLDEITSARAAAR